MAAELGSSQISALLESVPGIANVLRSPVADAIVNMIRAGAGIEPFRREDADELVQYAVRRGLIGAAEGDQVLAEIGGKGSRSRGGTGRKSAGSRGKSGGGSRKKAKSAQPISRRPVKKKAVKRR